MRWPRKPLVSSSSPSTASSLHFYLLSIQQCTSFPITRLLCSFSYLSLPFGFACMSCFALSYLEHLPSFVRRTTGAVSLPQGKHNTWKRKRSISLARTFKPSWIIHVHISAPHLLTSREVLLFSTPLSNEIWMAFSRPPPKDGYLAEVIRGLWNLRGCWELYIMSSLYSEDI